MPRSRRSDPFCKTSRRPTLCWYDASAHAWHVSPKGKCGSSASEIEFCKPKVGAGAPRTNFLTIRDHRKTVADAAWRGLRREWVNPYFSVAYILWPYRCCRRNEQFMTSHACAATNNPRPVLSSSER